LRRVGDYEWFVEVKKDGMTCLAFKEGQKVEIWSEDGTERTKELPKVADAIRQLDVSSCILGMEVELWEGGHHFPREAIAGKIHRKGEPETEGIVATVFECVYLNGKDLHKEDEEVRRRALDSIKFPQSTEGVPDTKLALNKLPTHRGRGREEIEKLMRKVINAPGSEGAVLKRVDAKYYLDGNSRMEWFKYHKTSRVFGIVYEIQETKKKGIFNYLYALDYGKYKVKQSQQVKVGDKSYIKVGKTFSTDTVVKKGQIIEIEIETLNFTVDERDDSIQIGCWCPRFLRIASERKTPDSVDEAVKRAKVNGVLSEKKIDKDGETHYLEKRNLEDSLTEVCKIFAPPPEDKTYRYAVSAHFIGKSVSKDTPIIIRKEGHIEVIPICDLFPSDCSGNELRLEGVDVWSRNGWTPIKRVFRHRLNQTKMFRIRAHGGLVDVTEDHSLFLKDRTPILGRSVSIGTELETAELPLLRRDVLVDSDYAFTLGFILAKSHLEGDRGWISDENLDLMLKCIHFFKDRNAPFTFSYAGGCYRLDFEGPKNIIRQCYTFRTQEKKVPAFVFDWCDRSKNEFLRGFLTGDGRDLLKTSKVLLQGILVLSRFLIVNLPSPLQEQLVSIRTKWFKQSPLLGVVTGVQCISGDTNNFGERCYPEDFVYDIETADHSFMAGVGSLIVHNSAHWDDRVEYNDKLQGFTLAVLMPGALKEPVETMAQARKAIKNPDLWKINPLTGEFRKRRVRSGVVRRTSIWCTLKAPEPKAWLGYEGVITAGPGRSKYHVGVLVTVDKGIAEYGSILPYYVEFFRHGKVFNGRYFYRMLPTRRVREVEGLKGRALSEYLRYNENEINAELCEIFKDEVLEPAEEQPARGGYFWLLIKPDDQTPYVLQKDTVQKGWVPPAGISALPKEIRKKVPPDLQYWKKKSLKERRKLRDELVKYFEEEKVTKSTASYVLQYQTFRGPIHVRFGPTTELWRFWIKKDDTILHYVFESDPLRKIAAGLQESFASEEEMNLGVGSDKPVEVKPGTRLNPTKNTPSFIEVVASGSMSLLEDSREFKKFQIKSGAMKGLWILFKERPDINIWTLSRTEEGPGLKKDFYVPIVKVSSEKHLVYGEVLVPDQEDAQGDIISADVIEDAAHDFLVNSRRIDVQHVFLSSKCFPVESYIAPTAFYLGDHLVKKGTWILVTKVLDEEIWKKVKNGELRGYSIRGIAESIPLD